MSANPGKRSKSLKTMGINMTIYLINTENKSFFYLSGISILFNFMTGICYEKRNVVSPHMYILNTFKIKRVEDHSISPLTVPVR